MERPSVQTKNVIPWTPFIPHKPHPKQLAFLLLNDFLEVGYGGSAGPGKSEALLMAALQFVDVPGYAAIIFRKTLRDLEQPSALLSRAYSWLSPWFPHVKYIPAKHLFLFPSGATLSFGYMGEARCEDRYQGAEYSFVGFDECTQHFEEDYLYLFSRLRQPECDKHEGRKIDGVSDPLPFDPNCRTCQEYSALRKVPLRMRSATNPGSIGHAWYKERFGIDYDESTGHWVGTNRERPFVPARYTDNPSIDHSEYIKSLMNLDPVTRAMLLDGDWAASQDARFKKQWFCKYDQKGDMFILEHRNGSRTNLHRSLLQIYFTIDPAASVREGIADRTFHKLGAKSHSVISCWGVTPTGDLLWLDMDRMQVESPELLQRTRAMVRVWRPSFVVCEAIGVGLPIYQMMSSMGIPTVPLRSVPDKVANAVEAQVRAEQGKVFLPRDGKAWLKPLNDEVFTWTGHPHEQADIIDTFSNACHEVTRLAGEDQFDTMLPAAQVLTSAPAFDMPFGAPSSPSFY